jgi:hypothetical protein
MANLLVNGNVARPLGLKANSTFALSTSSVAIALSTTTGVTSVAYTVVNPTGGTASFANSAPLYPYTTTLGPLNVAGTYIITMMIDGDSTQTTSWAITVLAPNGLRLIGNAETTQWDSSAWWFYDMNAAIYTASSGGYTPPGGTTAVLNGAGVAVTALPSAVTVAGSQLPGYVAGAKGAVTWPGTATGTVLSDNGTWISVGGYTPPGGTTAVLNGAGSAVTTLPSGVSVPIAQVSTPSGGTSSNIVRGDLTAGSVPAAALPAPAASTRGGIALPASSTGLFLRDDDTWATPPVPANVVNKPSLGASPYLIATGPDSTNRAPGSGAFTFTLPSAPTTGQIVCIYSPDGATNTVTIGLNGKNYRGSATNPTITSNTTMWRAQYDGAEWI